jgi:hypothetical protein
MVDRDTSDPRRDERDNALTDWATERDVDLDTLSDGQRWVIFAALQFLTFVGPVPPLRRFVPYFLSHCGLDLPALVVAAVVGQTDRAVRKTRQFKPREFWKRMQEARRGHPRAKLSSQDVGRVAKFLAEHKRCSVAEMLTFVKETFGVDMDRLTLRRFLKRYGLGCLWKDRIRNTPLLSAALSTAAPSP